MERAINSLWCLCGDFSMTLADKLLLGAGAKSEPYVEFVSSTAMTITPKYTNSGVTLQYSLDSSTWTTIATGATTPSANIIYFRGQATKTKALFTENTPSNAWTFTGATNLECNGKLDRLLQNTLGSDVNVLTIGNYCYSYMFSQVTQLIKAPALPATVLANFCYDSMFTGCTNLAIAPVLPATTLSVFCYYNMLSGCTNLAITPALPATTLSDFCYTSMFYGCTSLVTAPALPATTLSNLCYANMLYGCTSLITAPALPATVLANNCYNNMFYGCTSLKLSETMTGIYDTAYRIPTAGTGNLASNALFNMFLETGGTFTGTPTINTTYYTENTPV